MNDWIIYALIFMVGSNFGAFCGYLMGRRSVDIEEEIRKKVNRK